MKYLQGLAYASVIVMSIVATVVFLKNENRRGPNTIPPRVGSKLNVSGVGYEKAPRTAVFIIASDCRFCQESSSFFRSIADRREKSGYRLTFLGREPRLSLMNYLVAQGIDADEVSQVEFAKAGITGTPTEIVLDQTGTVLYSHVGMLSPDEQQSFQSKLLR